MDKYLFSTLLVAITAISVLYFKSEESDRSPKMSSTYSKSWQSDLEKINSTVPNRIPAIFLAHGSPLLLYSEPNLPPRFQGGVGVPNGPHSQFLQAFGPYLLKKYNPKAIVVFSAHWETSNQIEVMNNDVNKLYYDYYGFPKKMYDITWNSKGSSEVANKVVNLLNKHKIPAKTLTNARGLDHGVFIPFKLMFPDPLEIPLVEVSIDANLDPQHHIEIGKAVQALRDEGILIISGGLTIHTFEEWDAWSPTNAPQGFKDFENQIKSSVSNNVDDGEKRNEALKAVVKHPFFRRAHPREEHFIPIYVAAGAGTDGKAHVVSDLHGAITIAFGL